MFFTVVNICVSNVYYLSEKDNLYVYVIDRPRGGRLRISFFVIVQKMTRNTVLFKACDSLL